MNEYILYIIYSIDKIKCMCSFLRVWICTCLIINFATICF